MIIDSGERRTTFSTGAVRDIQEGKGRPTLMPLGVVAGLLDNLTGGDHILHEIFRFQKTKKTNHLYRALISFAIKAYDNSPETMLLEVSKHFEEGCKKYGEVNGVPNWQLGIPVNCYLDSAIRHYLKHRRGDKDESHDRAFVWNLLCCIWEVDHHGKN